MSDLKVRPPKGKSEEPLAGTLAWRSEDRRYVRSSDPIPPTKLNGILGLNEDRFDFDL